MPPGSVKVGDVAVGSRRLRLPMNFVPFAASKKRPECSAWLIVRSSISITVRPAYLAGTG